MRYARQQPQADCTNAMQVGKFHTNRKGKGPWSKDHLKRQRSTLFMKLYKSHKLTTNYVKRHGLTSTMRAFSVNDTMINGAPKHNAFWLIIRCHICKIQHTFTALFKQYSQLQLWIDFSHTCLLLFCMPEFCSDPLVCTQKTAATMHTQFAD